MPKPLHFNRWAKLTSAILCLIILIVCNIFTIKLANNRLNTATGPNLENSTQQPANDPSNSQSPNSPSDQQPRSIPNDNPSQQPPSLPYNESDQQPINSPDQQRPDSDANQQEPTNNSQSQSSSAHTPYLVGLTIQSLCIAAAIVYLALSHLCKKNLPETFQNSDKALIFTLGTILLTLIISLIEASLIIS